MLNVKIPKSNSEKYKGASCSCAAKAFAMPLPLSSSCTQQIRSNGNISAAKQHLTADGRPNPPRVNMQ